MINSDFLAVMDATWPAAEYQRLGPWLIRNGAGGGKRVSAASVAGDWIDIAQAVAAMQDLGQTPLFLIRAEDTALDQTLDAMGFQIVDPVLVYTAPVALLADQTTGKTYPHWPPLAIAREIWAEAGIGPARLQVMDRAKEKTAILVRHQDRVAGVAFVAKAGDTAMLHALEVSPLHRRQGSAQNLLTAAAGWAQRQGAATLSLVVTTANEPARALYEKLGMQIVGGYHYRVQPLS
jgi:ribosomal protein S18 acetylase RimI-like enzyme